MSGATQSIRKSTSPDSIHAPPAPKPAIDPLQEGGEVSFGLTHQMHHGERS